MADKTKKVFHYHAHGLALSGALTRPVSKFIEVQAASALPTIGGYGHARVENFHLDHHIHFKAGYSHVAGSKQKKDDDEYHTTLVTSAVEGLNFLDVLTADRVVTRLAGQHLYPESESKFSFLGSTIDGLRICGYPVEIELNDRLFSHLDTFAKVKKELETDKEFKKIAEDPFRSGSPTKWRDGNGVVHCSLVKKIKSKAPGVTVDGHAMDIPGFGRVYFAEALVSINKRTLAMLRFELGSPIEGSSIVSEASINGSHFP
ncbi:MAG TPA: hypothetical protein VFI38_11920 [Candidatus Acidoferrum sp.]|nr:hypothetical protein [Candidatus Acidoferrum sp.]